MSGSIIMIDWFFAGCFALWRMDSLLIQSSLTIVGIELSVSNIEINLLILIIYESSLLCLFLVNGILLMSSLSFNFRISVNNLLIISSFSNLSSHSLLASHLFLVFLFQSIHYFDSNSSLFLYFPLLINASVLTFSFERVGNLLFKFDSSFL